MKDPLNPAAVASARILNARGQGLPPNKDQESKEELARRAFQVGYDGESVVLMNILSGAHVRLNNDGGVYIAPASLERGTPPRAFIGITPDGQMVLHGTRLLQDFEVIETPTDRAEQRAAFEAKVAERYQKLHDEHSERMRNNRFSPQKIEEVVYEMAFKEVVQEQMEAMQSAQIEAMKAVASAAATLEQEQAEAPVEPAPES